MGKETIILSLDHFIPSTFFFHFLTEEEKNKVLIMSPFIESKFLKQRDPLNSTKQIIRASYVYYLPHRYPNLINTYKKGIINNEDTLFFTQKIMSDEQLYAEIKQLDEMVNQWKTGKVDDIDKQEVFAFIRKIFNNGIEQLNDRFHIISWFWTPLMASFNDNVKRYIINNDNLLFTLIYLLLHLENTVSPEMNKYRKQYIDFLKGLFIKFGPALQKHIVNQFYPEEINIAFEVNHEFGKTFIKNIDFEDYVVRDLSPFHIVNSDFDIEKIVKYITKYEENINGKLFYIILSLLATEHKNDLIIDLITNSSIATLEDFFSKYFSPSIISASVIHNVVEIFPFLSKWDIVIILEQVSSQYEIVESLLSSLLLYDGEKFKEIAIILLVRGTKEDNKIIKIIETMEQKHPEIRGITKIFKNDEDIDL